MLFVVIYFARLTSYKLIVYKMTHFSTHWLDSQLGISSPVTDSSNTPSSRRVEPARVIYSDDPFF